MTGEIPWPARTGRPGAADTTVTGPPAAPALMADRRLGALLGHARELVLVADRDLRSVYASPGLPWITGRTAAQYLAQADPHANLHPDDRAEVLALVDSIRPHPGRAGTLMARVRHAAGHWVHVEVTCTNLLEDPAVLGIVVNCRAVTPDLDPAAAATRLAASRRRLDGTLERLALSGGAERQLLTELLHDDPVHQLSLLRWQLEAAAEAGAGPELSTAVTTTEQILTGVRRLVFPRHPDTGGLVAGLTAALSRLSGLGLRTTLAVDGIGPRMLPAPVDRLALAVALTALDAVERNAPPKASVTVTVAVVDDCLELTVAGPGTGAAAGAIRAAVLATGGEVETTSELEPHGGVLWCRLPARPAVGTAPATGAAAAPEPGG